MSSPSSQRTLHHIANRDTHVLEVLRTHFKMSEERGRELIELGAIYLDKRRLDKDRPLKKGDYLRIHSEPKRFDVSQIDWAKLVVSEANDFLIVNKPAALPVHAMLDNAVENLIHQLRIFTRKDLFVTQRLDVPVTGLVVFAKNQTFQAAFNKWLKKRRVRKLYCALSEAAPPLGLQVHYMQPSERSPRVVRREEIPGWLRCELTIHETKPYRDTPYFESLIELHTGRTHQIRVQLSDLGAPLLGDRLYGAKASYGQSGGIGLCSVLVEFPDPPDSLHRFSLEPRWFIKSQHAGTGTTLTP